MPRITKRKSHRTASFSRFSFSLACSLFLFVIPACFAPCTLRGAEENPFLVVSGKSVDSFLEAGGQYARIIGYREAYDDKVKTVRQFPGLDRGKPIGLVVFPAKHSGEITFFVFAPVTRIEGLLMPLTAMGAMTKSGKSFTISQEFLARQSVPSFLNIPNLRIEQVDNWAFLGNVESFPEDPTRFLQGADASQLISGSFDFDQIPTELREEWVATYQAMLAKNPNGDQSQKERSVESIKEKFVEFSKASGGISIDPSNRNLVCEVSLTAKSGSRSAREYAAVRTAQSSLGGFLNAPNPMLLFTTSRMPINDEMRSQLVPLLESQVQGIRKELEQQELTSGQVKLAQDLVQAVCDAVVSALEQPAFDGVVRCDMDSEGMMCFVAFASPEAKKVSAAISALRPEVSEFVKIESSPNGDLFLSSQTVANEVYEKTLPPGQEFVLSFLKGKDLKIVCAVDEKALYFAWGDAERIDVALKDAIAKSVSKTSVPERVAVFDYAHFDEAVIRNLTRIPTVSSAQRKIIANMESETEGPGSASLSLSVRFPGEDTLSVHMDVGSLIIGSTVLSGVEAAERAQRELRQAPSGGGFEDF